MLIITILLLISNLNTYAENLSRWSIYINDEPFIVPQSWIDSAATDPESAVIRYKIIGAHSDGLSVTTRIRLPQVLSINEVVKQIILYYLMLDEEEARHHEEIIIFPYFTEAKDPPSLRVKYQNSNTINIELREWKTVKRPATPSPEERDIYNQIIEDSFSEVQEYEKFSDEIFIKIAQANKITPDRVIQIYKDVYLWHLTR